MENRNTGNNGIGFAGLLTIVFIVLKLCGVISWPCIWVLSPLWITAAITITIVILALLLVFLRGR